MKKLLSVLAFIFAFTSSYAQFSDLTIMNHTERDLTVTVIAGHAESCSGMQSTVLTIPSGTTVIVPAFDPEAPLEWLLVCNDNAGACDTYYNTLVPNTCMGNMPGAPPSTVYTGTWLTTSMLELR